MDHYKVLGLARSASKEEIKQAFRKLALQCHPDKHTNTCKSVRDSNTRRFKQVAEAYEVLVDDRKRAEHDLHFQQKQKTRTTNNNNNNSNRTNSSSYRTSYRTTPNDSNSTNNNNYSYGNGSRTNSNYGYGYSNQRSGPKSWYSTNATRWATRAREILRYPRLLG
ncbi:hypothetical protein Vadar_023307 [Vaccinium darrowii]|uniref:Uncharacterized protein n=1 Tax=Vaccinium darrowii TaxID=229202 RepID=A0ACB7YNS6_9ERIC|nr:hypothetical protein Vadar_023307 [Vaccinium darrowii]